MSQPTNSDLAAEVEDLRASLDEAHGILTRALGYDEPSGDGTEDGTEDETEDETEDGAEDDVEED